MKPAPADVSTFEAPTTPVVPIGDALTTPGGACIRQYRDAHGCRWECASYGALHVWHKGEG